MYWSRKEYLERKQEFLADCEPQHGQAMFRHVWLMITLTWLAGWAISALLKMKGLGKMPGRHAAGSYLILPGWSEPGPTTRGPTRRNALGQWFRRFLELTWLRAESYFLSSSLIYPFPRMSSDQRGAAAIRGAGQGPACWLVWSAFRW